MKKKIGDLTLRELKEICDKQFDSNIDYRKCNECPISYYCDEKMENVIDYYLDDEIEVLEWNH